MNNDKSRKADNVSGNIPELKEQAAEQVPPYLLETWLGGAASMCLALAQTDDEVTDITCKLMEEFFPADL